LREKFQETGQKQERVILMGVELPGRKHRGRLLAELAQLVDTAGGEVVGELTQHRARIDPTYYVGTGKVQQLVEECEKLKPDLVVFDNDLTGAQIRNIEKLAKVRVIDRSELILDIFAKHARTSQSKLQVELAQLEYELPRLKRMWTHLSRYEGGIGTRGPGEKQLEDDKRVIRNRIHALKRKLSRIERHREREVFGREAEFNISIVGYTNAGKSTLLNRLTGTDVITNDQLFVTLDTKTALWDMGGTKALLSDTVGFIRDIPHHLIASFHATLEEVVEADLLLHVVDASDPDAEYMVKVVKGVLEELGCASKPTVLVLNKMDAVKDPVELTILSKAEPRALALSARTGKGVDELAGMVLGEVESRWVEGVAEFSAGNGRLLAKLCDKGDVISRTYTDESVRLHVKLPIREAAKLGSEPGASWSPVKRGARAQPTGVAGEDAPGPGGA
jgi:GTP-binding protein HflX